MLHKSQRCSQIEVSDTRSSKIFWPELLVTYLDGDFVLITLIECFCALVKDLCYVSNYDV